MGIHIGRDHITSTIYTITYAGAALPVNTDYMSWMESNLAALEVLAK